jgi:periplasmic copper chaperone A
MSTRRSTCVSFTRIAGGVAIAVAAALAFGGPTVSAHVGTDKDEVAAGASTTLTFSIGHGCEESPTTSMRFQIPESVLNAAPVVKPGWGIEVEKQDLSTPVDAGHGDQQTDRTSIITFTAQDGSAVENGFRDNFTLAFTAPDDEGPLYFKVIQGCTEGENAWIDEWDGTGDEPENPAPSIMVVAAAAGEDTHDEGVAAPTDDDDSNGLAIVALVVGALGLAVALAALVRGRASTTA